MDSLRLGNAVITGATADSQSAIANLLARHGCKRILLGDSDLQKLKECRDKVLSAHPSVKVEITAFERSDEEEVDSFFASATRILGRIDVAVNLICQDQKPRATADISLEAYNESYSVYQRGAFLIQRALLRQMLQQDVWPESSGRGSIVNVVELGPTASLADRPLSAAVANAIVGLSKTDAFDYAPDKIRVNCVAAYEALKPEASTGKDGPQPLRSVEGLANVANTVAWLSSPGSSWLTGLVVPVDGGASLNSIWGKRHS